MSRQSIRHGLFFFALTAALGSCIDPPDFDDKPELENASVSKIETFDDFSRLPKDSVIVSVRFKDGDGDLGLSADDRRDTAAINSIYRNWGNYEIRTFRRLPTGQFTELNVAVNQRLFFPRLKREDKPGPLEGTLDFSQSFFKTREARMVPVKFRVRIRDRRLRESNTVETDTISVPVIL